MFDALYGLVLGVLRWAVSVLSWGGGLDVTLPVDVTTPSPLVWFLGAVGKANISTVSWVLFGGLSALFGFVALWAIARWLVHLLRS